MPVRVILWTKQTTLRGRAHRWAAIPGTKWLRSFCGQIASSDDLQPFMEGDRKHGCRRCLARK